MTFLRGALDPPFAEGEIRVITLPAPVAEPAWLLSLDAGEPAVFWAGTEGPWLAGLGAATVVRGSGPNRAAQVAIGAEALWRRLRPMAHPEAPAMEPRLMGGLSFLAAAPAGRWQPFGQATFLLPRILYARDQHGGRLAVAVTGNEIRDHGPEPVLERAARALDHMASPCAGDLPRRSRRSGRGLPAGPSGTGPPTGPDDLETWRRAVASIQQRIAAGRAEKIVAARTREVTFRHAPDPVAVLLRLDPESAQVRFAFRFGGATFLGATPERLASVRGLEVRTEALAGSVPAGNGAEAALRSSPKERSEHEFVVRAIADALTPLCSRLDYSAVPGVRRLRHVLHLETPFVGHLARPVSALDLVERLHPTPAVGGSPVAEALDWIAREEGLDRGWYAAPVGWFDAHGNGDFAVALRSALLTGHRVVAYAGAGIVAASDAAAELAETEVKLRTMLDALGVRP
jgi:isochorismate synthase